jgi:hypothetical protein
MSYRPICDTWILARSKTKYYGAYPAGFLHRARALLGVGPSDAVLHICGGKIREYPYRGLGINDKTLDLDPACNPDYLQDARDELPLNDFNINDDGSRSLWNAVLIDRPYTEEDAEHYVPGADALPNLNDLIRRSLGIVPVGHRVASLDYLWPHPGKMGQEVAVVAVGTGRNSRARWFCVFERVV